MASPAASPPRPVTSESWTVLRMILWSAEYLAGKGVERARLDAEHLLAHALGLKRLDLYLQHDRPLEPAELDTFRPMLKRRAAREPLQYVLGHQPFRELDLAVDRRVLIPRPETEVLVGAVLEWAAGRNDPVGDPAFEALDIGTGSGAIALSLAAEGPFGRVVATDMSGEALEVAATNRAAAGLDDRVELRHGRDFDCVQGERFDVVVSNPPYVEDGAAAALEPEVAAWEPGAALFAGLDGLDVIRRLVEGAPRHLREGGLLALEVGADQPAAVAGLLEQGGAFEEVTVRADLTGRERVVMATLRTEARTDREEA